MDFAVAAIRCFDTLKIHHDKRWLRQQRLLCISTHEILNCPWPAPGSKAMKLFELFSSPPATGAVNGLLNSSSSSSSPRVSAAASSTSSSPVSPLPPVPPAAMRVDDNFNDDSDAATSPSSSPSKKTTTTTLYNKLVTEEMKLLEERYQKACDIVLSIDSNSNSTQQQQKQNNNTKTSNNLTSLMQSSSSSMSKNSISFDDIRKILNPTKVNTIAEVSSTALKGDDHLCINFKNDHPYYYISPAAIDIAKLVRTRFVAWTSARLVEGNFTGLAAIMISSSSSPNGGGTNLHGGAADSSSPMASISFNVQQIETGSPTTTTTTTKNTNGSRQVSPSPVSSVLLNGTPPPASTVAAGYSRISELFQAGVIELPTTFDVVDHLQSQIMLLTKALDWLGEPASVFASVAASLKKLSDDTALWKCTEESIASGDEAQAIKQRAIEAATSPNSRSRAQSQIVVGDPLKAKEFRERFDDIRDVLVRDFLVSGVKEVVQPEKSLSERLAFWRSPRRVPQFDDSDEAELVAEMALQNLLYRDPQTLKNLWADIQVAFREQMELFAFNCRMLAAPVVPFAYFGISPEFESVRFDLVRYHLQTLMGCKTPSMMLNSIVAAIKSVIVCIKARHVLSKRWSRAISSAPSSTHHTYNTSSSSSTNNNNNNNNNNVSGALKSAVGQNNNNTASTADDSAVSGGGGGFWTREELDQIASEAKKHSSYNTDDILPVFIYIVVHCDLPQLLLYNRFLEVLSFEGEASERSFYVTVFYSTIQWILDWKRPSNGGRKSRGNSKLSNHETESRPVVASSSSEVVNNNSMSKFEEDLLDGENSTSKRLNGSRRGTKGRNTKNDIKRNKTKKKKIITVTKKRLVVASTKPTIVSDDTDHVPSHHQQGRPEENEEYEYYEEEEEVEAYTLSSSSSDSDNDDKSKKNNNHHDNDDFDDDQEEEEEEIVEMDNLEDEFFDDAIWEQAAALAMAATRGIDVFDENAMNGAGNSSSMSNLLQHHNLKNKNGTPVTTTSPPSLPRMSLTSTENLARARTMTHSPFSTASFGGTKK